METGAAEVELNSVGASGSTVSHPTQKFQHRGMKRKHHFSHSEGNKHGRGGGRHHTYHPPHKKAKQDVSSTRAANSIMRFRLGGSVSDPLNLQGGDDVEDKCSTCAPSPVTNVNEAVNSPSHLPPALRKDPLNLEEKVKNFPVPGVGTGHGGSGSKVPAAAGQRKKPRRRTTSGSKPDDSGPNHIKSLPKEGQFRYGNYNRYYGYRNSGANEVDLRLSLLQKEWFEGQDCLDIGCNTGQVTIRLAREMNPSHIVGMDIDYKLIKMAWMNLHRSHLPSLTPDGHPFPSSLTITRGPLDFPPIPTDSAAGQCSSTVDSSQLDRGKVFPHNIQFVHGNYVPKDDASIEKQDAEFDVILALSITKWIHLNWGDVGIKRFFQKVYHHLRPGGRFILEPQPFSSYSKKKKLTAEIFKNYQEIKFRPQEFHDYLLSVEVGFSEHQFLGVPNNKSKGFQRPLHLYVKPSKTTPTLESSCPHSAMMSGASSPSDQTTERLKSVVVAVSAADNPCANYHPYDNDPSKERTVQ